MKVSRIQWKAIRALIEAGEPAKAVASQYGICSSTIHKRSSDELWVTKQRLTKASKGQLKADDPATVIANLWKRRGDESRENVFQGASKALSRFFAMSPVPATFQEAATAKKMLDQAINPDADSTNHSTINLAVLTQAGFTPKPVVDV